MPAYMEYMKNIAELLKKLRMGRGWSQADLARRISVDQPEVSRWEKGTRAPTMDRIVALADVFDVSIDVLTGKKEKAGPPVSVVFRSDALTKEKDIPERRSELIEAPLVEPAVAAQGHRPVEDHEVLEWVWILRSEVPAAMFSNFVAMRAGDASMEPVLRQGAIVCINRTIQSLTAASPPLPDEIYAVVLKSGDLVLRHVSVKGPVLTLIPARPARKAYPVLHLDLRRKEGNVVGQVIWVSTSLIGGK